MEKNPLPESNTESAAQAVAFVEALVAAGLRDCVISPGSRSTPLVLALQRFPEVDCRVILDERSAAFFALGVADRTHSPVALVCTSGTAGANYYPAVIEASERGVPLLLLTADRPPELRDCGAGQTIDQVGLFGKFVRWTVDASVPQGGKGAAYAASLALDGYRVSTGLQPGPVHFNLPFREPFLPAEMGSQVEGNMEKAAEASTGQTRADWNAIREAGPGLILVGAANPAAPRDWVDGLFRVSDFLGWPILADVLNPVRHALGAEERVVTQYEGLLAGGGLDRGSALYPKAILQVGILPTAKSLRQWLDDFEGELWQWSAQAGGLNPSRKPFRWIAGEPSDTLIDLPRDFAGDSYRSQWLRWEAQAVASVSGWIDSTPANFEGRLFPVVSQIVPSGGQVFVANSGAVRDAERFWFAHRPRGPRIFSNRGASGIDGLVSMVAGLADEGPPTFAVLGDLAFLHDVGGLRAAANVRGALTIIVIDNGGGRIFEQLPVRSREDIFEEYFLTPQQVDLAGICKAHGIVAHSLGKANDMVDLARKSFRGTQVWILKTDGTSDVRLRGGWRELFSQLAKP